MDIVSVLYALWKKSVHSIIESHPKPFVTVQIQSAGFVYDCFKNMKILSI